MPTESADVFIICLLSACIGNFKMQQIPSLVTRALIILHLNLTPPPIERHSLFHNTPIFLFLLPSKCNALCDLPPGLQTE